MYRLATTLIATGVSVISGCAPRVSPPPTPDRSVPQNPITASPAVSYEFAPDIYRYRFNQTADIRGDGPTDTVPSNITTRGIFVVQVIRDPDSSISVSIRGDSISIDSQGSIPTRGRQQASALDTVIAIRFSGNDIITTSQIPDSLCAYNQVITAARGLLLPELGIRLTSPTKQVYQDTVTQHTCRAGALVSLVAIRTLRDLNQRPAEFSLEEHTDIRGTGLLGRDSITITGSINTRGRILFGTSNRLPSSVKTESEGRITVHLGATTTTFRQASTQEIALELAGSSP